MSEQLPDEAPDRSESRVRPVVWGLVALVAVAVLVGGVLAIGANVATKVTGLSASGDGATASATQRETLYLPEPTEAGEPSDYVSLADVPEPKLPSSTFSDKPKKPKTEITLFAAQDSVGQMEQIDLSGSYVNGSGAVLRVQQFKDGGWSDFPVTVPVNGDSFATYIQASALGENRFRVLDTDTGKASNEIRVTIS